jgi:hypothetical protein
MTSGSMSPLVAYGLRRVPAGAGGCRAGCVRDERGTRDDACHLGLLARDCYGGLAPGGPQLGQSVGQRPSNEDTPGFPTTRGVYTPHDWRRSAGGPARSMIVTRPKATTWSGPRGRGHSNPVARSGALLGGNARMPAYRRISMRILISAPFRRIQMPWNKPLWRRGIFEVVLIATSRKPDPAAALLIHISM